MHSFVGRALVGLLLAALAASPAAAQRTATAALPGVAVDSAGGLIPGASVVVANKATGSRFTAVTNETGSFNVPALDPGIYTVSVSLSGFKTAVVDDVRL